MEELLDQIEMKVSSFTKNARAQAEKGNKSAGQRARKISLNLEPLLKKFRKLSLEADKKK